jgi:RNA polymerase-binding transcription factor DksA
MAEADTFQAILTARKAELDTRLRRIADELDEPNSRDVSERAIDIEDEEVLEGVGNAGAGELKAVEAALERIRLGTFGTCVRCGEPISVARLTAVPHAAICERCIRGE